MRLMSLSFSPMNSLNDHFEGKDELEVYIVEAQHPTLSEFVHIYNTSIADWTKGYDHWYGMASYWKRNYSLAMATLRPTVTLKLACSNQIWEEIHQTVISCVASSSGSMSVMEAQLDPTPSVLVEVAGTEEPVAPLSPTSSLDEYPLRQTTYNYGNIQPNEAILNEKDMWIEGSVNMTSILLRYRDGSIEASQKTHKCLSMCRALSLTHMYLFSINETESVAPDQSDLNMDRKELLPAINEKTLNWCRLIYEVLTDNDDNNFWRFEELLSAFNEEAVRTKDHTLLTNVNIMRGIGRPPPRSRSDRMTEDTFVHDFLSPFLQNIFSKDNRLQHLWANSSLESCLRRSRSTASSGIITGDTELGEKDSRYEPDYTSSVAFRSRYFDLFLVEVKKPNQARSEDLRKLGIMLKIILDRLVQAGIANPAVCGLLVNGANCSTYRLDIKGSGMYRLTELMNFDLITKVSSYLLFPALVAAFSQVKEIVLQTADAVVARFDESQKQVMCSSSLVPMQWLRVSAGKPKQQKKTKRVQFDTLDCNKKQRSL